MMWNPCQVGAGVIAGFSVGVAVLSASVFTVSALLPDELIEPKWYSACLVAVAGGTLLAALCLARPGGMGFSALWHGFGAACVVVCTAQAALFLLQEAGIVRSYGRFTAGSFDNVAGLASCLCIGLPVGLRLLRRGRRWQRVVLAACKAVSVAAIVASGSRTGLLCAALCPDHSRLQDITLNRKYPHFNRVVKFRGLMKGGHFEAANKADFSDAVECAVIKKTPRIGYDTLSVSLPGGGKYRYWRFVAQDRGKCNTAEIKLISGGAALEPVEALGAGNGLDGTKPADAFDGDELTYYISDTPANGWVGVDMGKPVSVDKIAYKPRNDDNDVTAGHTYELCYFENGRQRSAGVQRAAGGSVTFRGVPSGALYVLHDLDKGTEERIFTYVDGEVRWY